MPGGAKEVSCLSWLARTYNTEGLPVLLACCTAMFISWVGCFQRDFTSAHLGHTEVVIATLLCTPRPCQMPRIQPRLLPEKRCCHSSPQAKSLGLANIEDKVWLFIRLWRHGWVSPCKAWMQQALLSPLVSGLF